MTHDSNNQTHEQSSRGFAGTLRNIQLIDIIQMCCLAGTSLCIRVRQDTYQGTIHINEGEVVHAEFGATVGIEAFFSILGWRSGQFETLEPQTVKSPTIKEACQFLLMEAARLADEQALAQTESVDEPVIAPSAKLRVLIVDDSPIMAKILTSMMVADPDIEVVGSAKNGEDALAKMKRLEPDLITMDVNMPVMDGSTALKHIMIESPCPVLIMSNLGPASYASILTFLNLGAVDFMSKPVKTSNIVLQQQRIVNRVHTAAKANVARFQRLRRPILKPEECIAVDKQMACKALVIINSGIGGYLEMVNLVTGLPGDMNACVLSRQTIPPPFAPTLATYLNARSRFEVLPLAPQVPLNPGRCYICTSGHSLQIDYDRGVHMLSQSKMPRAEDKATECLDQLLNQAVNSFSDRVVVVLLSGAELDSMDGLRKVKAAGGRIVAPPMESCILPATIEPAIEQDLVTDLFNPADADEIFKRYCA